MDIIDDPATLAASRRFESLGQNCEMGFALRKIGNEDGQLLRWAVVPVQSIARLIADPPPAIYRRQAIMPWQHDMVWDSDVDIAFHCGNLFAQQADGSWTSAAPPEADEAIYRKDAEKIGYMYDKFVKRLTAPGTILVYKDLVLPSDAEMEALVSAVRTTSRRGAALAVVYQDASLSQAMQISYPDADVAIVAMREVVDNKYAETASYEHWHQMFRTLDAHFATQTVKARAAGT